MNQADIFAAGAVRLQMTDSIENVRCQRAQPSARGRSFRYRVDPFFCFAGRAFRSFFCSIKNIGLIAPNLEHNGELEHGVGLRSSFMYGEGRKVAPVNQRRVDSDNVTVVLDIGINIHPNSFAKKAIVS